MAHILQRRDPVTFALLGRVVGAQNLSYTPRGAALGKSRQAIFTLPMTLRKSLDLQLGDIVEVVDTTVGVGSAGYYLVDTKSESVAADGYTATFTCPDLLHELARQSVPGFAQTRDVNGVANEDVPSLVARLVAIPGINGEPAWTGRTTLSGFAGVGFTARPQSVQACLDKLAQERFASYRLGANADGSPGRVVELGAFGASSGLRLERPSANPGAMNRPYIRPILTVSLSTETKDLANCLVPTGGSGGSALTLADAFRGQAVQWAVSGAPGWQVAVGASFPGYDAANYPIYRRIAYDGSGYQYFLTNAASVAQYRQRWAEYPKSDIAVNQGTAAAADFAAAGAALYLAATAELRWTLAPAQILSLTTLGRGDLRGLAGNTVVVNYPAHVTGRQTLVLQGGVAAYEGVYTVLDVTRTVNDSTGDLTDTWTLSSSGRAIASGLQHLTDAAKAVDHILLGGHVTEQQWTEEVRDLADANHPLTVQWDANPSIGSITEVTFIVTPGPARGSVVAVSGDGTHGHDGTLPSMAVSVNVAGGRATGDAGQFAHNQQPGQPQGNHNHNGYASGNIGYGNGINQGVHAHGGALGGNTPGGYGIAQGSHNHAGYGSGNIGYGYGVKQGAHAHGGAVSGTTNGINQGSQAAYGHAENISANRNGAATKSGSASKSGQASKSGSATKTGAASKTGTVQDGIAVYKGGSVGTGNANTGSVQGAVSSHVHGLFIQGGGTPGTLDNGGFVYAHSGDKQLRATGGQQIVASTNPPDGAGGTNPTLNTDHAHNDSITANRAGGINDAIGVNDQIGVNDAIGVNDQIGVNDAIGVNDQIGVYRGGAIGNHSGFNPVVGVGTDGGHNPVVGIYTDPGHNPVVGVGMDGGHNPVVGIYTENGFYPTVGGSIGDANGGFSPSVNIGATTGTGSTSATPVVDLFATTGKHVHSLTHGVWVDPNYRNATTIIAVNGVSTGLVYQGPFTVDLAAYLQPNAAATIGFAPDVLCRYSVRRRTRVRTAGPLHA